MINMANEFEKIFDKLTNQYDPNKIFNEFLDYCIDINLFTTKSQDLDFQGREKYYFEMFKEWIKITNDHIGEDNSEINSGNNGWYDYLGIFYENIVQTKYKAGARGQFFTPADVCQAMTELTINDNEDYDGKLVNDCCCGSGRFLLAGHSLMPGAIMIGSDLDEVACKMSVLNFYIHGVRGSVLHQNTLTGETFNCWKINDYLGYGLPIPHIQLTNITGAYQFIGMNNDTEIIGLNNNNSTDNKIVNEYKPKGTGQTTLF